MHLLITGGTGFIGSQLINKLQTEHQITVLTRNPASAKRKLGSDLQFIADLAELDNLDHFDAVINLAGEPIVNKRWTDAQKQVLQQSRWNITERLVALFKRSQSPPACFISGSAIGYYGRQDDTPIDEQFTLLHPEFSQQLCQKWEHIALQAHSSRTRVCLLRTGIVLAKGQGALAKMTLPFKLGLGGPIGNGQHYMSWIHIDDMINGLLYLLKTSSCHGPYNMTAPNPVTNSVFSQSLAKSVHRPCLVRTPKFVLKLLMGEMADLLIYGQNVLPIGLLRSGFQFKYTQIQSALDSLKL